MRTMLYSIALLLACGLVHAHSGGTDAQGCHTNRKTGDYHYHSSKDSSAPATPQPSASKQSGSPTCYVGPRGGTYTIAKSGRKNYSSC